ncbi:MAG: TonB-dependent receptor [Rhodocyclaceae bacterium]
MRTPLHFAPAVPPHRFIRSTLSLAVGLALPGLALAQAQPADGVGTQAGALPAVSVSATREDDTTQHLTAPVSSGALGSRSQLETPFSTTVVNRNDLEEQQPTKLGELFATDASVVDNSGANSAWASYMSVRGLPLDWQNSYRIDGKPFVSYVTTLPYEMFEQVDLLKGASGFMYGFGTPGGLVNYVSKRPTDEPLRSIDIGYTSDSVMREHVDLGGRAGEDDRFGYRLNATHEEGAVTNGGALRRDAAALALDVRLTDRLTWDLQSLYQKRHIDGQEPSITTYPLTSLPSPMRNDDRTLVGQGTYIDNEFSFLATGLNYRASRDWTLSANYGHSSTRTRRDEAVFALQNSNGDYSEDRSDYGEHYEFDQAQVMAEGRLTTGPVSHQVVAGLSWQDQTNYYGAGGEYKSGIGSGTLGEQNTTVYYSDHAADLGLYQATRITQQALFASDTLKWSDWSLLAGLRYTDYQQKGFGVTGAQSSQYDKKPVTPTLALMYNFLPRAMVYASYVESLEQGKTVSQTTLDNYGATLDPLESKQYELGVKIDRDGWAATAAVFRIERGAEYISGNAMVQDGMSLYQGLEMGATALVGSNWTVGGNLMLLKTEYQKGQQYEGNRVAGAPKFVGTAQVAYRVPFVPGLKLRADAKYTGSSMMRAKNDLKLSGFTVFNLGASYDTSIYRYATTFRVGIKNLANKRYWEFQYDDYIRPSDPRTVTVSATLNF